MMKEHQQALISDTFASIRVMLNEFEAEVNKMDFSKAHEYVKPIAYLMVEAVNEVKMEQQKRISDADNFLNSITKP